MNTASTSGNAPAPHGPQPDPGHTTPDQTGHATPDPQNRTQGNRTPRRPVRSRGEAMTSTRRVRAQLRAQEAVRLRAQGLTYDQIAVTPDPDGVPLYTARQRAQEAVAGELARGAAAAARELLGRRRPGDPVPLDLDQLTRLHADLRDVLSATRSGALHLALDQRAALTSAALVVAGLLTPATD